MSTSAVSFVFIAHVFAKKLIVRIDGIFKREQTKRNERFPKEAGGGVETVQSTLLAPLVPEFLLELFSLKGLFWFHACSWFVFVLSFRHGASCLSTSLRTFNGISVNIHCI